MQDFMQICQDLAPGSTVLVRVDFNLSRDYEGSWILNDRVYSVIPLVKQLLAMQFGVILVSHLGRPRAGVWEERYSLSSLCESLEPLLGRSVNFLSSWPFQKTYLAAGMVALAENTRFLLGDRENDSELAKKMVESIDCVVMEAFACSHRRHASTVGLLQYAKRACLGPFHIREICGITKFLHANRPRVAYIGGKKISTKLPLLVKLLHSVEVICFGGGIANTLLHVKGYSLGTSWVEYSFLKEVSRFCALAERHGVQLMLPVDVATTVDFNSFSHKRYVAVGDILPQECIVDVGPETVSCYCQYLLSIQSAYWNGPFGIYEYRSGTGASLQFASTLASSSVYSLIGGGDTLSLLQKNDNYEFSHVSTGGGAFLYYLANQTTPVLDAVYAGGVVG